MEFSGPVNGEKRQKIKEKTRGLAAPGVFLSLI
jgi:hypothetical protein